jgi:hypothetical protein
VKLVFSRQQTRPVRPVARTEDLLVEEIHDETVVFDTRSREAHCLSPLATLVFANCDGETSVEDLAALATDAIGEPVDTGKVHEALAQLEERSLLMTVAPDGVAQNGLSRRQVLKRGAVTGGLVASAPLITSVFPPPAVAGSTASCGGPPPLPTVLCCPCTTGSGANKEECCSAGGLFPKCVCTSAEGNSSKFCKPQGPSGNDSACGPGGADMPPCEQCCTNQTVSTCGGLKAAGCPGADPTQVNCTGPCGSPCPGGCQTVTTGCP